MKYLMGLSLLITLLLTGCTQEKKEQEVVQKKQEVATTEMTKEEQTLIKDEEIEKVAQELKDKTSDVIDTAAAMAKELSKESKVMADDMKVESNKVITKIAKETKAITTVAVESLTEVKKDLDVKMDEVISQKDMEATPDEASQEILKTEEQSKAEGLYLKCAGCHGQKAERSALNKSQIIQGWDAQKIVDALKGYQAGTYGSIMKGLMQGQVAHLSDEEIQLLADYITTLK